MENQRFTVKFATTEQEKQQVYSLRYTDMLKEYRPELVIENGLDYTPYDDYAKQIICIDNQTNQIVGSYRLLQDFDLPKDKKFACQNDFDVSSIINSGHSICELTRAVVKKEYRNTPVLTNLLRFVITYIKEKKFRFVVGEASMMGNDKTLFLPQLSYLANFCKIEDYPVFSLEKEQIPLLSPDKFDEIQAKRNLPPLFKAYLGFGAKFSDQYFTDVVFGSVDVFVLMDTTKLNDLYIKKLLKI
ncbi:MAG: GNAT family N-acetyltransferase [Clostridia bacterium]|nr:GNAT family N-acetyltransferase [Clostridia bacterium]